MIKERLLSADIHSNGLVEDVYLISPNNSGDGTVQLALTHLSKQYSQAGMPLVLIHGQFSNRSTWFDQSGGGFAEHLAKLGYDVWMPEMRGHGLSPENQNFQSNSLADYVNYDLPAVQTYLLARLDYPAVWFGYGLSGLALSMAVAKESLDVNKIRGLVLLGLDDPRGAWRSSSLARLLNWRERKKGYIESDLIAGSLEPEAYGVIHGGNPLRSANGAAAYASQQEYKKQLAQATVPLLMLEDAAQETDQYIGAAKVLQYWGGSQKSLERYAFADSERSMLTSDEAMKSVERWLTRLYEDDCQLFQSA